MKKEWSKLWKASAQVRKQRKYAHNAPLHIKHKMVGANLTKELRKEYGIRTVPVRKGDTVRVETGSFKGKSGKVSKVSLARVVVYVEGVEVTRTDGSKAMYPVHPSNLSIIKLDMTDKKRVKKLEEVKKKN